MRWYINDLSVQGQYTSPLEFVELLSRMLALKIRVRRIGSNLFCSRDQFRNRPVLPGTTVVEALRNSSQRDLRNMSLSWLDKSGPFLEDSRLQQTDDLFFFENHDVTDQGLGEAARQRLAFRATASFSFPGGQVDFCKDSLFIQQGFPNELISTVQLQNFWTLDGLEKHAQLCEDTPDSWTSLLAFCASSFDRLLMSSEIAANLKAEPFSRIATDAIIDILRILQSLACERDGAGKLSKRGGEIRQQFFVGGTWFSDESSSNKVAFKKELTFIDPCNLSMRIFAPWHGKIQTPQYRVHFEYPVPATQKCVKILYIGPKLTKR